MLLGRKNSVAWNPLTVTSLLIIGLLLICALAAPYLAPQNPSAQQLPNRLQGPSLAHWLGTDELGRDELSRIIFGARISVQVGMSVVAISLLIGALIGSLAGFYGGILDRFFNIIVMNTLLAFPGVLLALALVAFLGPGMGKLILALSIGGWIGYARLVRGEILKVKELDYVQAARALGTPSWRLLIVHIWPNITAPVIVQSAIGLAGVILSEATLSFLGLGIPAPAPSWGGMLSDGRNHIFDAPHLIVFPALSVMLAVLAFNFLGDALRDYLDPRLKRELL
ncbi:MAG: ABC transporter permease [Acidobacteria bacterium]|nr:ABC transporter permease [Acidobacteriota bacterium]